MRNLKKFLALILAMMMTFSLMVTVNASSFKDDEDITKAYNEAVDVLTGLKVIQGYEDKTFQPKANITRGEVAAILYRIVTGDVDGDNLYLYKHDTAFKDVYATDWYAPYINFCENNTLIEGVGNNMFKPNDNITGYEALTMILRAIGYDNRNEYRPVEWKTWASGWGSRLGLTANIKAGSLGAPATREVVSEIMFKGIQADMVSYSILNNYTPILLVDASEVKTAGGVAMYKSDVAETLMHQTFGIVGKSNSLSFDAFGRPNVMWVTDLDGDTVDGGTKYILNDESLPYALDPSVVDVEGEDEAEVILTMTPVKVYDNAIDECHMTKDINNDKSIYWGAITEYVNGEELDPRNSADGFIKLDELHTTTKWIGATGRTLEVYKLDDTIWVTKSTGAAAADQDNPVAATDVSVNKWIFVYVDTFLGEVTSTTNAVKDTAGHEIIAATATVALGNDNGAAMATITVDNPDGKFKKGDLVLIQTSNADNDGNGYLNKSQVGGIDAVDVPERAPLYPQDVPATAARFADNADEIHGPILLDEGAKTVKNVTINATVGAQDAKMGIIASDGTTYMASNAFLASRTNVRPGNFGDNTNTYAKTTLAKWYDMDDKDLGITNSMIGRTYDLVLDHHGYIIGMKEVLDISDGVGVITGIDSARVGSGKYVSEVEAYMTDGTTKTFQLLGDKAQNDGSGKKLDVITDSEYGYFPSLSAADAAWQPDGMYEKPDTAQNTVLNVGSLVQFKSLSYDGKTFYKIVDWDQTVTADLETMVNDTTATGSAEAGAEGVGTLGQVATGVTGTLNGTSDMEGERNATMLNNNSVIFVAEYEYRYNTSGNNDGSNINKTYKVYEGFKKMPTITGIDGSDTNILYQRLGEQTGNGKYVLIYAQDTTKEYTIKAQDKIAVDDSYLVLSRGATYATYSEYNVLKNGVKDTLQVSNANTLVNAAIEATMTSNELLLVTGRNAAGYVTSVTTVKTAADASNTNALLNTGNLTGREIITGSADVAYSAGVLKTTSAGQYLTVDDNVKVQLVNRDQKTVTDIDMSTALVYMKGQNTNLGTKNAVFELNELGYVCALYVIE